MASDTAALVDGPAGIGKTDFSLMLDHRRRAITDRDLKQRFDAIEEESRRRAQALSGGT